MRLRSVRGNYGASIQIECDGSAHLHAAIDTQVAGDARNSLIWASTSPPTRWRRAAASSTGRAAAAPSRGHRLLSDVAGGGVPAKREAAALPHSPEGFSQTRALWAASFPGISRLPSTRPRWLARGRSRCAEARSLLLVGPDRGENPGERVVRQRSESAERVGDLLGGQSNQGLAGDAALGRLAIGCPLVTAREGRRPGSSRPLRLAVIRVAPWPSVSSGSIRRRLRDWAGRAGCTWERGYVLGTRTVVKHPRRGKD